MKKIIRKINIPSGLKGNYLRAYLTISKQLSEDPSFICAFLSGSMLRGEGGPYSDIDIIALMEPQFDFFKRKQGFINNTFYELFMYSKNELEKSFRNCDYQDMHMVGFGFPIFGDKKISGATSQSLPNI